MPTTTTKPDSGFGPGTTSVPDVTAAQRERASNILKNTVIFKIEIRRPSLVKKLTDAEKDMLLKRRKAQAPNSDPGAEAEGAGLVVADHDHLRMSKDLIDNDAMRPLRALDAQYKASLRYIELKSPIVGGGAHLIPLVYMNDVVTATDRYKLQRAELIEAFIEQYPDLKAAQMAKDPELFKASDYPTTDELRSKFDVDYEIKSDEPPIEKLRTLNDQQLRRELEKVQDKWRDVGDDVLAAMRAGMAELVSNAVSQLGSDDGKPRVFRNSLVDKVNKFLETFDGRNAIVGDQDLPRLVEELRGAMQGVTPDTLRKDEAIRERVQQAFEGVATEMQDKLNVKVRRRVLIDRPEDRADEEDDGVTLT